MNEKKILMIVDDDEDDRYFFRSAIRKINNTWECWQATHGAEALEKLRAAATLPDYIFLDINMPGMNGKECLAELKKDEQLKQIPVVMYSTSTYIDDIESTKKLGAAYFLSKPSDINVLPKSISQAIEEVEKTLPSS